MYLFLKILADLEGLRSLQQSWGRAENFGYTGYVIGAAAGLVLLLILAKILQQARQERTEQVPEDPEGFFAGLLKTLELTEGDKRLLRELARGARLAHPAMCLLSPELLSWAGELWRQEAGEKNASQEKLNRLEELKNKIWT